MNAMHEMQNVRHTITINDEAFLKLRDNGLFGESYSDVILRLTDKNDAVKDEENIED